jgi:hypothetical protein
MTRKWWNKGKNNPKKSGSGKSNSRSLFFRPKLEWLEYRETPSTITVTSTADTNTTGTFRNALNTAVSGDKIVFNIGDGVQTISPASAFPTISVPITIDGRAPGAHPTQVIDLNGISAGAGVNGLQVVAGGGGTTIEALVIRNFNGNGIELDSGTNTGSNTISGDFIGTDTGGTAAHGNSIGVLVNSSGNTIGGTAAVSLAAGAGNLVSGNTSDGVRISTATATGNLVEGNFIGTNLAGTTALGNGGVGLSISQSTTGNNTVGGTASGAGNVISGNTNEGILLSQANNTLVEGSLIGTDKTGANALPNGSGVHISGASGDTVGGSTSAARNIISGNSGSGIAIDNTSSNNSVEGNYVGLDKTGVNAVANGLNGITITGTSTNNTVGGTTAGAGNIISGNTGSGVSITGSGTTGNGVLGNTIGINAAATPVAVANAIGVSITGGASSNTVGGMASGAANIVSGNSGDGIFIQGTTTNGNLIEGNLVGTNPAGTGALANTTNGVEIQSPNNTVGGTASGAGNVISGNTGDGILITGSAATGTLIQGNFIGTNKNGTSALANGGGAGVEINGAGSNTVGGTTATARNVISGNQSDGIEIHSAGATSNAIQGNYIGLDKNGTNAVTNGVDGVVILGGATGNTIGGTASGSANIISGNTGNGVDISGTGTTGNVVEGNTIGINAAATPVAIPNATGVGILSGAANNTIGGTASGAANLISGNTTDGVDISGTGTTGNLVVGDLIGTNAAGTSALGNGSGVVIENSASSNTIGGTTGSARNVISGNGADGILFDTTSSANTILGNYVGLDKTGVNAIANVTAGIMIQGGSTNNSIGGTASGEANVIAGNTGAGLSITGSGTNSNLIQGNSIGVNAAATPVATANGTGVLIFNGAKNNTIGGTSAAAGNIISGNSQNGIDISDAGTSSNLVENNNIGTNKAGTAKIPNSAGITIENGASGNLIGGNTANTGNLISGNAGDGVLITGMNTNNNVIQSNVIGTNTTAKGPLANQNGIEIQTGAQNNTIGGTTSTTGNIISGNAATGVLITGANTSKNVIEGNFIGADVTGNTALANADGVVIKGTATNNTIGGTVTGSGNLISGNTNSGITIKDAGTTGNQALNNTIGLDVSGAAALANPTGVLIEGGANGNTIGTTVSGAGNVISGNTGDGMQFNGMGTSNNQVEGNFIGTDSTGKTAVANNVGVAVRNQATANTIGGTVSAAANLISGNATQGVLITGNGVSSNVVEGNFIGSDTGGTKSIPNMMGGVAIQGGATGNFVGGTSDGVTNVISGNNGDGVVINGSGANGNFVQGNYIGTQNDGTTPLANTGNGVSFTAGAANNTVGGSILTGGPNIIGANGAAGILVDSTSSVNFSGANFNTNSTDINNGTLKITTGNAIAATSAVIINSNGMLDLNNNSDMIASLSDGAGGGGNVLLGSRTLTVGDSTNTTFSGVISGSGATGGILVKVGSGTLTLNGINTYQSTTISAGKLLINGVHSGSTPTEAVLAGATLGGNGSAGFGVAGFTTVNGTISPGDNSTGVLTVQGALFQSGSTLAIKLLNNQLQSGYDQLAGKTAGINLETNAAMLNLTLLPGFASNVGDVFDIVSNPAGVTGTFAGLNGTTMALTDGTTFVVNNTLFRINYTLTDVMLTHVAASTTTTLVTSGSPSTVGFQVTFTATVAVVSPGTGTPTGSVTFMDGMSTLGTQPLSNGAAAFSTSSLTIGTHSITAIYGGTPSFGGSPSNTVMQNVISGTAAHFVVSAPSTTKAGSPFSFVVTAKDAFGNVSTTFSDTVTVTTSDATGVIQTTPYTFTTGPGADNGIHTFTVTLKSSGLQSVTVTDTVTSSLTATANVTVVSTFGKDIIGRISSTGQWFVGLSNASSGFTTSLWATWSPNVNWTNVVTGDFNGDGMTDIAGRDPASGNWFVGVSTGSSFTTSLWATWSTAFTWVDIRVGDFLGNGKMDITGRALETGQWWVAQSNGTSFTNKLWDTWSPLVNWVDVQVGDFNGDGKADLAGRVLSNGTWWVGLSNGTGFNTTMWATWSPSFTWVDVHVGDFDGDGKSDITGRALQNGQWWTAISNSSTAFNTSLWATWNPNVTWADVQVGDFNGDGKSDIVGRFLQTGQWFTGISNGTNAFTTNLWATWNPNATWADVQVGDFNVDGLADITGRFLQTGQWFTGISNGTSTFTTSLWATWSPAVTWVDVHTGNFA